MWRYIAKADALCKRYFNANADHLLSRHLLQRRQLYAHALGAGDYSTALRTLDSEAKLEGLFPATKVSADVNLPDIDAAINALLAELAGPRQAGVVSPPAPEVLPAGPGPVDERRGDPARPVASETIAEPSESDIALLFPAERQIDG